MRTSGYDNLLDDLFELCDHTAEILQPVILCYSHEVGFYLNVLIRPNAIINILTKY